jgi:hypothetical protein
MSRIPLFVLLLLAATSPSVRATDITYTVNSPTLAVGASTTVTAPQFDSAVGVLTSVRVTVSCRISGTWSVENTGATPTGLSYANAYVESLVPVGLPGGNMPLPNPAYSPEPPVALAAFDGTIDYAGASGTTMAFTNSTGDGAPIIDANITPGPNLQPYIGTGAISIVLGPVWETAFLPVNVQDSATIQTDARVTVLYTYDPFPAHICRPLSYGGCPCGNTPSFSNFDNGCANSMNVNGGRLDVSGTASIATDSLVLVGSGMTSSSALYFQGTTSGSIPSVYGDGMRCVGGSVVRLGTKINAAGTSQYPVGGDLPVSVRGNVTQPGPRYYQVVYRDNGNYCMPDPFNITSGLAILWTP